MDEAGLGAARRLFQKTFKLRSSRKALIEYQIDEMGKSKHAARKWIQRHEKGGKSFEGLARELLKKQNNHNPA